MIFEKEPPKYKAKYDVVGCFAKAQDKFLLLHRRPDKPQGNTWCIIGGKAEAKDSMIQTMRKEFYEETGIRKSEKDFTCFKRFFVRYPEYDFNYHVYSLDLGRQRSIRLEETCHQDFRWVTPIQSLGMNLITDLDYCIKKFYNI